jgi:hypothetical protein
MKLAEAKKKAARWAVYASLPIAVPLAFILFGLVKYFSKFSSDQPQ